MGEVRGGQYWWSERGRVAWSMLWEQKAKQGECRTKQPAWSWKVKHKYSSGASQRKWRCNNSRFNDWLTGMKKQTQHQLSFSLTSLFWRGLHTSVRKVTCKGRGGGVKKGRLNPVETWLTEEPQCCSLTGSPRLAAASVCKANDASWGSHICFPPWPHVLWVNAAPPWLNTGNPITNEVLLGLLCIHPQKLIDERVIMHAHRVGVCRLVCSPL